MISAWDERSWPSSGGRFNVVVETPSRVGALPPTFSEVINILGALRSFISAVYVAYQLDPPTAPHPDPGSASTELGPVALLPGEPVSVRALRDEARDSLIVEHISMNSPLTLDLILTGATGGGVAGVVGFLIKHPDKIGEWWPKLQTSWYNNKAEAEKARKAYKKLRNARVKVTATALPGPSSPGDETGVISPIPARELES